MGKFRIALGAEVDAVTSDELKSGLDGLRGELTRSLRKVPRIMRPLSASNPAVSITTGENITLSLGSPSTGRIWVVTRVTVMGADDHTAVAAAMGAVYVGYDNGLDLTDGPGLSQCVLTGTAIPFTTVLNEHAIVVHDREILMVNVAATGALDSPIVANALVWEYPDAAIDSQVI